MQIIINASTPESLLNDIATLFYVVHDNHGKEFNAILAELEEAKKEKAAPEQISLSDIAPPKLQTAAPTPAPTAKPAQVPAQAAPQPLPVQPVMPLAAPAQQPAQQPAQVQAVPVQSTLPTAPAPSYTQEQISVACVSLADQGKRAEVLQLMQSFGAASIIELKPEQYGNFALALRQMGAQI